MTIISLAQNFVGSNNLNLLQPIGQFGTRLHGGKDSASPRYIFTMLRLVTASKDWDEMVVLLKGRTAALQAYCGCKQPCWGTFSKKIPLFSPTHTHTNCRTVWKQVTFFSSPLARLAFPALDDSVLKFLYDDNQRVEPEWYIPIIPMVLINGAEGIGTGWSCKIPNFDIREVVNNIRRMLDGEEPLPMVNENA